MLSVLPLGVHAGRSERVVPTGGQAWCRWEGRLLVALAVGIAGSRYTLQTFSFKNCEHKPTRGFYCQGPFHRRRLCKRVFLRPFFNFIFSFASFVFSCTFGRAYLSAECLTPTKKKYARENFIGKRQKRGYGRR